MNSRERKKYLVYAEDDVDDREILQEMIETISSDIEIVVVSDGLELLRFLSDLQPGDALPCFILLDINMPVMDGYTTLRRLKEHAVYREITVIMYSTSSEKREQTVALQMGAARFITKPFTPEQMSSIAKEFASYCDDLPIRRN